MKKYLKVITILFTAILLFGCAETTTGLVINNDESIDIYHTLLIKDDFIHGDLGSKESLDDLEKELKEEYKEEKFTFNVLKEGDYSGFQIIENVKNYIGVEESTLFPYQVNYSLSENFLTNSHTLHITIPSEYSSGRYSTFVESTMLEDSDNEFFFQTKYKVDSHNADTFKDNKLTWEVKNNEDTVINVKYISYNTQSFIIIGVVILLFISVIIGITIFNKKIKV